MRYALLIDNIIDNVVECEPGKIAELCQVLGYSAYVLALDSNPATRYVEPGGKFVDAATHVDARGDGLALDPATVTAAVRAKDVPLAERAAAEAALEAARAARVEAAEVVLGGAP